MVHEKLWNAFAQRYSLSERQLDQFQQYAQLLVAWNKKMNLTAITEIPRIIAEHFEDSLALAECIEVQELSMLADVGSGAGFPGLPLKIMFPTVEVVLIEVIGKRRQFLQHVVDTLGLEGVIIEELDWRTFLRSTDYPIDLFCTRASLQTKELLRMFKPNCIYQNAHLVYWASHHVDTELFTEYSVVECAYSVNKKPRKLIVIGQK